MLLGLLALALGAVVLVGWLARVPGLTAGAAGFTTMKPNTALCFVLCGTALVASSRPQLKALRVVAASGALVIAGLTVAEYLTGVDLRLDQALLDIPVDPLSGAPQGRMAAATAAAFSFVAASLLLMDGTRVVTLSRAAALAALSVGLLAILGYALDVSRLQGVFSVSSVAPHTAAGLLLLSAGILLARPEGGVMGLLTGAGAGGHVARRLILVSFVAPVFIAALHRRVEQTGWLSGPMVTALAALLYIAVFTALALRLAIVVSRMDEQRQAADEAGSRQRAQLDAVVGSAMDGIIAVDAAQRIVLVNPAAERMFQREGDSLKGQTLDVLLPQSAIAVHRAHRARFASASGEARRQMGAARPMTRLRADGEEFPLEASISRTQVDGRPILTAILRDLTERQRDQTARRDAERASTGQVQLPGQHEPRDPHPAERDHRPRRTCCGATELTDTQPTASGQDRRRRTAPAVADQRHPGPVQDRGRAVAAGGHGLPCLGDAWTTSRRSLRRARAPRASAISVDADAVPGVAARRPDPPAAGPAELAPATRSSSPNAARSRSRRGCWTTPPTVCWSASRSEDTGHRRRRPRPTRLFHGVRAGRQFDDARVRRHPVWARRSRSASGAADGRRRGAVQRPPEARAAPSGSQRD
ncbi:MAG: PAS domain S-box protein [Comamonadaceae bacterium]|nr:PAS domain S-box protein [Comamonadaceae bacterium]